MSVNTSLVAPRALTDLLADWGPSPARDAVAALAESDVAELTSLVRGARPWVEFMVQPGDAGQVAALVREAGLGVASQSRQRGTLRPVGASYTDPSAGFLLAGVPVGVSCQVHVVDVVDVAQAAAAVLLAWDEACRAGAGDAVARGVLGVDRPVAGAGDVRSVSELMGVVHRNQGTSPGRGYVVVSGAARLLGEQVVALLSAGEFADPPAFDVAVPVSADVTVGPVDAGVRQMLARLLLDECPRSARMPLLVTDTRLGSWLKELVGELAFVETAWALERGDGRVVRASAPRPLPRQRRIYM